MADFFVPGSKKWREGENRVYNILAHFSNSSVAKGKKDKTVKIQ